jgi:hypothetical protein
MRRSSGDRDPLLFLEGRCVPVPKGVTSLLVGPEGEAELQNCVHGHHAFREVFATASNTIGHA